MGVREVFFLRLAGFTYPLRGAFFFDDLTAAFAGRRFVADFFGASVAAFVVLAVFGALADFFFATLRFEGPAAARAASRSSASWNVSSSTAFPFGRDAFVVRRR